MGRTQHGSKIQVRFGGYERLVDPLNLWAGDIDIRDAAWSLSKTPRFTGFTNRDYSCAQHSLLVSEVCDPEDALEGLLHDVPEAWMVDLPTPIKYADGFEIFREYEHRIGQVVCSKFKLKELKPPSVKDADDIMFLLEQTYLMPAESWKHPSNDELIERITAKYKVRLPSRDRMVNLPQDSNFVRWQFLQRYEELRRV